MPIGASRSRSSLRRPDVNAKLRERMLEPVGTSAAEAAKFFADETALWSKVIKDTNVTPE